MSDDLSESLDEEEPLDVDAWANTSASDAPVVKRHGRGPSIRTRQRRARTESLRHISQRRGQWMRELARAEDAPPRPQTRAECRGEARPCPWVACKFHLYLDINHETGSIKINFPDREPWELADSCALDVAERGGITLEEVGEILNLTRERVRQLEVAALLKLKMASPSPEEIGAALLRRPGQ